MSTESKFYSEKMSEKFKQGSECTELQDTTTDLFTVIYSSAAGRSVKQRAHVALFTALMDVTVWEA